MINKKSNIAKLLIICISLTLTACGTSMPSFFGGGNSAQNASWDGNPSQTFKRLVRMSSNKLKQMEVTSSNPQEIAWVKLALISKQKNLNSKEMARRLILWKNTYPNHPANSLLPNMDTLNQMASDTSPKQIAVLIPQSGALAGTGKAVQSGLVSAYAQMKPISVTQTIKFYDTAQTHDMNGLYQKAVQEGADMVIGPLTQPDVQNLVQTTNFSVPTIALNYTEGSSFSTPTNFYEFGLLPEDEVNEIASLAREQGLSRGIIIAPNNEWGKRLYASFVKNWQGSGGSVVDTLFYEKTTTLNDDISRLLHIDVNRDKRLAREKNNMDALQKQGRRDFDVIFLFAKPTEGRIIIPLLRFYYVSNTPIYATSSISTGRGDTNANALDLHGVIICDLPSSNDQAAASSRLYSVGKDAYLLSESLKRLNELPNFPIYGATGAMTLSSNHQIHRRLPCTAVSDASIPTT